MLNKVAGLSVKVLESPLKLSDCPVSEKESSVRNWNKHAIYKWNAAKNRMLVLCVSPLGLQVTNWMQLLKRFSV